VKYSRTTAIAILEHPTKGDMTYVLAKAYIAAKLNTLVGNDSSTWASTSTAAPLRMARMSS
jgi:hypothetical protein